MEKIYCQDCKDHTEHVSKLDAELSGFKVCDICRKMNFKYLLTKPDSDFTKGSSDIKWIIFDEIGRYKEAIDDIEVGSSLLMSPFNMGYTWLTTIVTEIVENTESFVVFKTQNSLYKLYKICNI